MVPSPISAAPLVFVPMVRSSPEIVRSPAIVVLEEAGVELPTIVIYVSSYVPFVEWSEVTVNVPFKDFNSYPSPASPELSDTSSNEAIPSVVLEFFTVNAPVAVAVVKSRSPSVSLDRVSPLPKVISLPVIVISPVTSASPPTVRLSPIVVSDVECPSVIAMPDDSVATFIVPVAFVMYEFVPSW